MHSRDGWIHCRSFTQRLARAIHLDNKRKMTKVVGTTISTTLPAIISDDRLACNSASDIMLDGEVVAILQELQQDKSPSALDVNEKSGGIGAKYSKRSPASQCAFGPPAKKGSCLYRVRLTAVPV